MAQDEQSKSGKSGGDRHQSHHNNPRQQHQHQSGKGKQSQGSGSGGGQKTGGGGSSSSPKSGGGGSSRSGSQRPNKRYFRRRGKRGDDDSSRNQRSFKFGKVSIIIPLFNEEESLNPLSGEIKNTMKNLNQNYEVIFVDDGSTDGSLRELKEICRNDNKFKYISFQKNNGKSAALQAGFDAAKGDAVVTMDADLQDDPKEIPNLLEKLQEGTDMVSGWKKKRYDPFIKRTTSKLFNFVTRIFSGVKIHDFNCGLKAYRRSVVNSITVYGELHRYIPVLANWKGFSVAELAVHHHPRKYGTTKYGISRFFKGFVDLLTVIFLTRYIQRPMHLFGFLGAIAFIAGFAVNLVLSFQWWFHHMPLSNRPLLFLGMLLMIVGIQLFSVGLIGELIVHNSKTGRDYTIKDKSL